MSSPVVYFDGRPVQLGKRIGRGGEGDVFIIDKAPNIAVKLYTTKEVTEREQKVLAIINAGLAKTSPLIAFPFKIAKTKDGRFAGFAMRLVKNHKPFHELYAPAARKKLFPEADYRFLVRAALNISKAVAQVHSSNCVIGDINHSGILISDDALVALIDADSFQFDTDGRHFLCRVGVPEYTPPELHGRSLDGVIRTQNHDAFGLAVSIFQLLFMGRHPYAGVYQKSGDMPLERAIPEHRFAYSKIRSVDMTPPPAASDLDDVPAFLASAFEQAFEPPANRSRPLAAEWINHLQEFEKTLRKCRHNSFHYYSNAAKTCPWCDLEAYGRVHLFLPVVRPHSQNMGAIRGIFDLDRMWPNFEAILVPDFSRLSPIVRPSEAAQPTAQAIEAKSTAWPMPKWAIVAAIGILALLLAIAIPKAAIFVIFVALLMAANVPNSRKDYIAFRREFEAAIIDWEKAKQNCKKRSGIDELEKKAIETLATKEAYLKLNEERQIKLGDYERNRRDRLLDAFLDQFRIADHKIRGIGPGKTMQLASFGIETAADIERNSITAISGFGPASAEPLILWRNGLANRFVYSTAKNPQDSIEIAKIEAEISQKRHGIEQRLSTAQPELAVTAKRISEFVSRPDPEIAAANRRVQQAVADLRFLEEAIPLLSGWPPKNGGTDEVRKLFDVARLSTDYRTLLISAQRARRTSGRPSNALHPPACPSCGSIMIRRVAKQGRRAGSAFWGCSTFPRCKGTRPI